MSSIQIAASNKLSDIFAKALAFPIDNVIFRYSKDKNIPLDVAKEHALELKKYLALCTLHPDRTYGMSWIIDEIWHTFICFTRDYHRFCDQVAGMYIHHQPASEEELRNGSARKDYLQTLNDYKLYFGEPPIHLWPVPISRNGHLSECSGCKGCGDSTCGSGGCSQCKF